MEAALCQEHVHIVILLLLWREWLLAVATQCTFLLEFGDLLCFSAEEFFFFHGYVHVLSYWRSLVILLSLWYLLRILGLLLLWLVGPKSLRHGL